MFPLELSEFCALVCVNFIVISISVWSLSDSLSLSVSEFLRGGVKLFRVSIDAEEQIIKDENRGT